MANEQQFTGSQVAGVVVGGVVGTTKGSALGTTLCLATAPFLGPLALLFVPLGTAAGAYMGVKVGSKGLGHAALMIATGAVAGAVGDGIVAFGADGLTPEVAMNADGLTPGGDGTRRTS